MPKKPKKSNKPKAPSWERLPPYLITYLSPRLLRRLAAGEREVALACLCTANVEPDKRRAATAAKLAKERTTVAQELDKLAREKEKPGRHNID